MTTHANRFDPPRESQNLGNHSAGVGITYAPSSTGGHAPIYSKYGFLGCLLIVTVFFGYYIYAWHTTSQHLPISFTILSALRFGLYLLHHFGPDLRWLFATAGSAAIATARSSRAITYAGVAYAKSLFAWWQLGLAAVISIAISVETPHVWKRLSSNFFTPDLISVKAKENELREKEKLLDELIAKTKELYRQREEEVDADRKALARVRIYVNGLTIYVDESLSARSQTEECETGCIGGKPYTIWDLYFGEPTHPQPVKRPRKKVTIEKPPLKITPDL
jgi:hypothetical protein